MTGLALGLLLCCAACLLWPGTAALSPSQRAAERRTNAAGEPAGAGESTDAGPGQCGIRDTALMLDLAASMLSAGRPLNTILQVLSDAADPPLGAVLRRVVTALELGAPWEQAWDSKGRQRTPAAGSTVRQASVLRDALTFAASSGAPSSQVLHAQAAQLRRRRAREAERRAAALGIHLVLPLGLCALPAFLCFTVVPLLLALMPEF